MSESANSDNSSNDAVSTDVDMDCNEAMCVICREPYMLTEDYGVHTSLSCGCHYHFFCLLHYIRSKLGNRFTLDIVHEGQKIGKGILCPKNAIDLCPVKPRYVIPQEEFLVLSEFGQERSLPDNLNDSDLEKIHRWIFSKEEEEEKEDEAEAVKENVPDPLDSDQLILATTKPCPKCQQRVNHAHGHQCHHVNPGVGCLNCRTQFCYKCLSPDYENRRMRGSDAACQCGRWVNFCSPFRTSTEIREYLHFNPYPIDSRCGCALCSDCRPHRPCSLCHGNCVVCQGILPPGPQSLSNEDVNSFMQDMENKLKRLEMNNNKDAKQRNQPVPILDSGTLLQRLRSTCINANYDEFQQLQQRYIEDQTMIRLIPRNEVISSIHSLVSSTTSDNARRNLLHYAVHSTSPHGVRIAEHLIIQFNVSVLTPDSYQSTPLYYIIDACVGLTRRGRDIPCYLMDLLRIMFLRSNFDYLFFEKSHGEPYYDQVNRIHTAALGTFSGMSFREWVFSYPPVLQMLIDLFPRQCKAIQLQFYAGNQIRKQINQTCVNILLDGWNQHAISKRDVQYTLSMTILEKNSKGKTLLTVMAEDLIACYSKKSMLLSEMDKATFQKDQLFFRSVLTHVIPTHDGNGDGDGIGGNQSSFNKRRERVKALKDALPLIYGLPLKHSFHYDFLFQTLYQFDQDLLQDLLDDIDERPVTTGGLMEMSSSPSRSTTLLHVACAQSPHPRMYAFIHTLLKDPRCQYNRCAKEVLDEDDDEEMEVMSPITPRKVTCWIRQRDQNGQLPIQLLLVHCEINSSVEFPKKLFLELFYATGKERISRLKIKDRPFIEYCADHRHIAMALLKPWSGKEDNRNRNRTFDRRLLSVFPMEIIWKLIFLVNDFDFTLRIMVSLFKHYETWKKQQQMVQQSKVQVVTKEKDQQEEEEQAKQHGDIMEIEENHEEEEDDNDEEEEEDEVEKMKGILQSCWSYSEGLTLQKRGLISFLEKLFRKETVEERTPAMYSLIRAMLREPLFLGCDSHQDQMKQLERAKTVAGWIFEDYDERVMQILFEQECDSDKYSAATEHTAASSTKEESSLLFKCFLLEPSSSACSVLSFTMFPSEDIARQWFHAFALNCSEETLKRILNMSSGTIQSIVFYCCKMRWSGLFMDIINTCSKAIEWHVIDNERDRTTILHTMLAELPLNSPVLCLLMDQTLENDILLSVRNEIKTLWNVKNATGETPFHELARSKPSLLTSILTVFGSDIDIYQTNHHGDTVLNILCSACISQTAPMGTADRQKWSFMIENIQSLTKVSSGGKSSDDMWTSLFQQPNHHGVLPIMQLITAFGFQDLPNEVKDNLLERIEHADTGKNDIHAGFDINSWCNRRGETWLHLIVRSGNHSLFETFLLHFAKNIRFDIQQQQQQQLELGKEKTNVIEVLRSPNVLHMIATTAHQYARQQYLGCITKLVKNGQLSPITSRLFHAWLQVDRNGRIPFCGTNQLMHLLKADLLIHKHLPLISMTTIDHQDKNILHHLIAYSNDCSKAFVEYLLEQHSNELTEALNQFDDKQHVPLMVAVNVWDVEVIKFILSTFSTNLDVQFNNFIKASSHNSKQGNNSANTATASVSAKKEKKMLREVLMECFKDAKNMKKLISQHK